LGDRAKYADSKAAAARAESNPLFEQWIGRSRIKRPEESLGYLLWQTAHGWMRFLNGALAEAGMTHLQFIVLGSAAWLIRAGKPPSQARLAEFCAMDPMLISKVVRMLEKKGAVRRAADPHDTRIKLVSLTRPGEAMLLRALPVAERAYNDFFAPVAKDEDELRGALMRLFASIRSPAD
jgi:DNA-binding MarR family transcriptional regulator